MPQVRSTVQFLFCSVADQPLIRNETDDDPYSKSSSAAAESVNLVTLDMIVA